MRITADLFSPVTMLRILCFTTRGPGLCFQFCTVCSSYNNAPICHSVVAKTDLTDEEFHGRGLGWQRRTVKLSAESWVQLEILKF